MIDGVVLTTSSSASAPTTTLGYDVSSNDPNISGMNSPYLMLYFASGDMFRVNFSSDNSVSEGYIPKGGTLSDSRYVKSYTPSGTTYKKHIQLVLNFETSDKSRLEIMGSGAKKIINPDGTETVAQNYSADYIFDISLPPPPPVCGDKVINQPNEQCEVGIACPIAGNICNLQNCSCALPPPPPIAECPKPTVHQFDYGAAHCGDIPVSADAAPHFVSDKDHSAVKIGDSVDTEWARNDQGHSGDQDGVEFPQPGVLKIKLFHVTGAGANPELPSTTYLGTLIVGRYQKSSTTHDDFKVLKAEKVRQTVDPIFVNYNQDDLQGTGWLTIIYVMADVENYNYSLDQIMAWDGTHPALMKILFHHELTDPFDPSIPPGEESDFFYQHDSVGKLTFLKPEEVADPCGTGSPSSTLPPPTGGTIPPSPPTYVCPQGVNSCSDGQIMKTTPVDHCAPYSYCIPNSGAAVLPPPAVTQVCGAESTTFFVTEQSFNANLGGLDGANAKCQAAADGTNLPARTGIKTWKAFLSDDTAKVGDLNLPAPYHLLDGTRIAKTKADLFSGKLEAPVNVTEKLRMILDIAVAARFWPGNFLSSLMLPRILSGSVLSPLLLPGLPGNFLSTTVSSRILSGSVVSGSLPPSWIGSVVSGMLRPRLPIITLSPKVWTGSRADGGVASDFCKRPSDGSKFVAGMTGLATSMDKAWLEAGTKPCNEPAALYCYGVGDFSGIKPPPLPPQPIYICPLMPDIKSCPAGQALKSISLDHCSSYNTCAPNPVTPQPCLLKTSVNSCPEGQVLKKIDELCGSYNTCVPNPPTPSPVPAPKPVDAKNFPFSFNCGPLRTDTNTALCTFQVPREIIGGTLNLRLSNAKILDTKKADAASPTMLVQLSTQSDNVSTTIHAEFKELLGKATTTTTTYPLLQLTVQADPNTLPINIMASLLKDSLVFLQP